VESFDTAVVREAGVDRGELPDRAAQQLQPVAANPGICAARMLPGTLGVIASQTDHL
jgi:hypothetical protein